MFRKYLIIFLILTFVLAGCSRYYEPIGSDNQPPISPFPIKIHEKISLYFPDETMTMLQKESRVVETTKTDLFNIIIEELIKGSQNSTRRSIIPKDTEILSLEVVNRVAYISFSKDLINKNYTEIEEAFVLYSIVNTLTARNDINQVQILIEGEIRDVFNKRYTILNPKSNSSIIVDNSYKSPIDVIFKYYEILLTEEYESIVNLFSTDRKKDVKRGVFRPYYQELEGVMNSYEINDYLVTGYDKKINVAVNLTIYYEQDKIKENQSQYFELIYEKGEYKIHNISRKSEHFEIFNR